MRCVLIFYFSANTCTLELTAPYRSLMHYLQAAENSMARLIAYNRIFRPYYHLSWMIVVHNHVPIAELQGISRLQSLILTLRPAECVIVQLEESVWKRLKDGSCGVYLIPERRWSLVDIFKQFDTPFDLCII